jgi:hypothetical protein
VGENIESSTKIFEKPSTLRSTALIWKVQVLACWDDVSSHVNLNNKLANSCLFIEFSDCWRE